MNDILNEKAGVLEFDNIEYRKEICQIAKQLKNTTKFNDILIIDDNIINNVKKYTFKIASLSWIDTVYIYYEFNRNKAFDAIALSNTDNLNLFKVDSAGHIIYGSIYIIDNGTQNLSKVLFHEMCHLYDNSKFKQIWMNDLNYYFEHQGYDITLYNYYDDVSKYSLKDIHNIITECMRFANFTESHAFMENINFEIFEYINKFNFNFIRIHDIENLFIKSSAILYDIYNLEQITSKLRYISEDIKSDYIYEYQDEINKVYYGFNAFDKVINYVYKKLHKIMSHAKILFNYYYNLDSEAKRLYNLDESEKNKYSFEAYAGDSKRKLQLLQGLEY